MKLIKFLSFGTLGVLTLILAAATVVEKLAGTAVASEWLYSAPWTVSLWTLAAVASAIYIVRCRTRLSWAALPLHVSFIVILAGAAVTHFCGEDGKISLNVGDSASHFTLSDGDEATLPFTLRLNDVEVECYPATSTPMDYVSRVTVESEEGGSRDASISMNKVLKECGYRFYQTGIGPDSSVFTVSYDPWGIGVSYAGYFLLFISVVLFFCTGRNGFRRSLKSLAAAGCLLLFSLPASAREVQPEAGATPLPQVLQKQLAEDFGKMLVIYNGRVCPVSTMARDFCVKLCGRTSYRGLTAEQVLTGWIFYYPDWKHEPMIKIKGERARALLGITGKYASLDDFYSPYGFKLEGIDAEDMADRHVREAAEKCALISAVCTGAAIKIFPVKGEDGVMDWLSWVDERPADLSLDEWRFVQGSMEYVAMQIAHGRYSEADDALHRIAAHQVEILGSEFGPDTLRYRAEMLYNRIGRAVPAAVASIVLGIIAMVAYCRRKDSGKLYRSAIYSLTGLLTLYLTVIIALRGIVGGHLPLGNGYETMMAMAWLALIMGLWLGRKFSIMLPAALVTAGMAMMVAGMDESNPQVSMLMPVLHSPLLSVHVMVIMLAYSLVMFMAINSVTALFIGLKSERSARLAVLSRLLLYPAVFLLAVGIFIGAIWANVSWGRYWGWDPKETWALITLLVYALPLHTVSFPRLVSASTSHIYFLVAFVTVLITYFGVNFFLSGMHSYA